MAALTVEAVGGFPVPFNSQSVETPRVAAIAETVLLSGFLRSPDSIKATTDLDSPAMMPSWAADRSPASWRAVAMRVEIDSTTTGVVSTTNVVKLFALTPAQGVVRCVRVAVHDRIKQIAKELGELGEPLSLSAMAAMVREKTGAKVSRQALAKIVAQSELGHESGHRTLEKCAPVWGYSYDWIMSGRGTPRLQRRDPLETAIELEAWHESAIKAARALAESGVALTVSEWARYLRDSHEMITRTRPAAVKSVPPVG